MHSQAEVENSMAILGKKKKSVYREKKCQDMHSQTEEENRMAILRRNSEETKSQYSVEKSVYSTNVVAIDLCEFFVSARNKEKGDPEQIVSALQALDYTHFVCLLHTIY